MDSTVDITLQINLSAGDVAYAELTVPALVSAHRKSVREVLGIVDCCRPQRTQMVDPEQRFPRAAFDARVEEIIRIAEQLAAVGVFDRITYIREGDPRISRFLQKYIGAPITETHDCFGAGIVSYLYGLEESSTRFVLHYDADMLLFQADGYDWPAEALERMASEPRAISATPRVSPPFRTDRSRNGGPSLHDGDVYIERMDGYWRLGWFSARCFLIDRQELERWLPLLTLRNPRYYAEVFARKLLSRGYPPALEVMIHHRARARGAYRLDLATERAFIVHPNDKRERFLRLLPAILDSVRRGCVPDGQRGWENLVLDEWESYLEVEQSA